MEIEALARHADGETLGCRLKFWSEANSGGATVATAMKAPSAARSITIVNARGAKIRQAGADFDGSNNLVSTIVSRPQGTRLKFAFTYVLAPFGICLSDSHFARMRPPLFGDAVCCTPEALI